MTIIKPKPHMPANWKQNNETENYNLNLLKLIGFMLIGSLAIVVSLYSINKFFFKSSEKANDSLVSVVSSKADKSIGENEANDEEYIQASVPREAIKTNNKEEHPEQTILQTLATHIDKQTEELHKEREEELQNAEKVGPRHLTISKESALKLEKEERLMW